MTIVHLAPVPARFGELDDVTLGRAQRGDAPAFRALVELYQDRIFALLWRFLGRRTSQATVEDLAQTTFLAAFRALPRFRPVGPARLSTWLLAIATRTALKARRDERPSAADEAVAELVSPEPAAGHLVDQRAFAEAVARAVDALAPAYRAAFILRTYHELGHAEIATALEIEIGTVKSRLARAREVLRDRLKEYAP